MTMLPPTRRRSALRSITTNTNRSVRLLALLALVAIAGTAFAVTNSSASSLGRTLFARATEMIAPAKATHADHALEAAELDTSSSTMATERRNHTATRLADGRVLIAGGENASGPLNTAEIYDPVAATFATSGNMNEARADHTATLLADGRVLLIGGRNEAGALTSTEIFDPVSGAFTSGPSMSTGRAGHTATPLADGRVFVAGGNAPGTAEMLNATLTAFAAAGTLNTARSMHSAALLADGRVVLIGGRDGSGAELPTGEIFDTPGSSFSPISGALKVARVRPHLRVLFDGKVQIIGGNNDRSTEIYDPLYEEFGAYAHVIPESDTCVGLAGQILSSPTRAALFYNGQTDPLFDRSGHTITEINGQALVLGGANSSGVVLNSSSLVGSSGAAAISTDKMDYEPGQIAHLSGRGFQPGETVRVKIHEDPHTPQERGFDVVADSEGNFSGDYTVMDYDLNMKFIAGARGLTSGKTAQTTFTDSNNFNVTPLTQTVAAGSTNTFAWVFTAQNSGNQQTTTFTVPAGWTTPQAGAGPGQVTVAGSGGSPCTVSLQSVVGMVITIRQSAPSPATGTCNNGTSFTLTYANATAPNPATTTTYTFDNQHGQDPTVVVATNDVATTLSLAPPSPASVVFGSTGPVTLSATLTRTTGGAAVSGATIDFKVDAATVGSGTTNGSGVATFSYDPSALAVGPHTVQASFAGQVISGTTYTASTSGTQTLTVTKRNTLTTVSSSLNPSTFGESVSFTATVVGTGAGAGNPSGGSVQFKIDGANFGAPVALTAGSASSGSISTLTAGNHTVEAFFTSADTNFNDSNDSLDGGQTVNKRNTLTTVSSSLNPSTFGESVSFTATVVGTGAGAGNPSGGSVQFKIDGANFGAAVPLTAGSASSGSISTLTAGNHTVEAFFTSADTNFNDSNDALDGGQTVNKRNTLTTVSSGLNPSTFGESVSFTASVVGTGAGAGNPSGGSVQFKIDGANFGAPIALTAGSASSGSISTLTAGNHTVEAFFTSADTNFNDSNDTLDGGQTVNKRNTLTTVSSNLNPSTFGESVSFTATVVGTGAGAGNPSGGSVQFKIDGANFGAPVALTAGSASSGSISTLTAGSHTVEAFFTSSDTNFNDSNDALDGGQTVNKRNTLTTVSSSLNPSTFGESVSFTATVVGTGAGAGNPSGGSVQFKIDGANFGAPVALTAGSASSGSISTLTAGNHTVEAFFTSADTNFNDSNDSLDSGQTVNKRNTLTTVSSSLNPSTFGESVSFTATVVGTGAGAGNPSGGSVQFKIDGANFGAPVALAAGSASSGSISTLTAGNHTVEAFFTSADTNFNDSNDSLDGGQTVNKRNTLTTVSSSLNPSTFGESVSFTATVVGTGAGAGNPSGGSVQFKIDGANFGAPVALTAGSASSGSISTLTAGSHTVEAFFTSSDTNFNDSNDALDGGQTVNKRNTLTTVLSSLNPSTFGESVSFTATVVGTGAGAGNPSGGSVQFKIDGANFGAPVPLTAGSASSGSISTLTAGNHTVEAFFTSADTNFNDSNDSVDGGQTVNKRNTQTTVSSSLNPSTFGESVSFTATVVGTGAGAGNPSGGSVQFKIDGANFGAPVALAGGSASSGSISTLTAGSHTVEAFFTSADTNFNDSNDSLDGGQTVNKRDTLTTVSSTLNPSTFGESVSFTATVVGTGAGAGNPSGGSVQFKIDGANFGAPVALAGGSASSGSISTLTAGNHTVEAFFTSTDTNFNDSNDALDGGQTVNKRNTLTTVSSSVNPSTFGESVSFTATVVGTGAGAGNPSGGSVQFKIDGTNFGAAVALTAGSATSGSISTLTAGNHMVEAFFTSADTNFNDSNDTLDGGQTVNKRNTLTTVSSSLNPSTFGESVSFTATVVGTGAGAGNPSGGSVQFKIDGANFGAPVALAAGSASSGSISTLTAGNHTVEAFFTSADTNFNDSNDTLDGGQTVNKRNTLTTVSSSVNPSTFGESVSFTATVVGTGAGAGNPGGGSVQFKIDGANFGAPVALAGGSASSGSISTLTAGNHLVEAFFTSADTNFNDSNDSLDGGQTVNKRDTLTTVSSSLNPSTFGQSVSFTATVVGTGAGTGNPTGGSVQFKIDGANFGAPVALTAGSASSGSISTLTAGNHTVEAFFTSADTNFNDSNDTLDGGQTVNKRNTLTTVSSSLNPSTFGESVSFTATVVGTGAGAGNPSGGSVQFKIDGANFGAPVALAGGSASSGSISTLTAGNHLVEAFFTSADTNFNDSNDSLDGGQTVNKRDTLTTVSSSLNPSTFGQSVSFSATVGGTGAGAGNPSGGSVQFKIDGANFGAPVALTAGSASSGSISTLTAGNHLVEAFFTSADTNFNDSNDALDGGQIVNKRNTLTTVSSSLNPSTYGQSVTFNATVVGTGAGAGNPTGGSVQFKIDGANFGSPVTLISGAASTSAIASLTAGNHTVEAVFTSTDTNFNGSNDLLDGGQNVNKASLTITASSHTIIFNAPVPTITASYSGFVLGEGASNLTTQPTCSTTYTVGSLIGTYPTKCENAVSPNYTFTYVNGTVTVLTACSAFNGFLAPIGGAVENLNGGSFSNPLRSFKLNSTIPVKFSAICFGAPLTTGVHTLQAIKYSNATTGDSPIDATPTDAATTGNQFRLTDGAWHFNLATKPLGGNAQGIWLLKATLFDGSTYSVWIEIKK